MHPPLMNVWATSLTYCSLLCDKRRGRLVAAKQLPKITTATQTKFKWGLTLEVRRWTQSCQQPILQFSLFDAGPAVSCGRWLGVGHASSMFFSLAPLTQGQLCRAGGGMALGLLHAPLLSRLKIESEAFWVVCGTSSPDNETEIPSRGLKFGLI